MSGKTTGLTTLELRKQLLVVESELNRAHLVNELQAMKSEVHQLTGRLSALGTLVSSVTEFGSMITGSLGGLFGQSKPQDREDEEKPSWFSTLFEGARAGASLLAKVWPDRR